MKDQKLTVVARWDNDLVPAGHAVKRSLLIEVTAPPKPEPRAERPPINLALVIDRSGSMTGAPIAAARKAAKGIAESLNEGDRLSVVAFDSEIETLFSGLAMDERGRKQALQRIDRLEARSMTNLGGGWFEGAHCVAQAAEERGLPGGHVLVLSDGMANRGVCDPAELLMHASELADRGIKTSAVGIGANYSPLQLDALAEGGRGRLHDAETGDDIVDVVLGELGEIHAVTARNVELTLDYPNPARLDLLTRAAIDHQAGRYSIVLGDIGANGTRPLAVLVDLPKMQQGEQLPFNITVHWEKSAGGSDRLTEHSSTRLSVVPQDEANSKPADMQVVAHFADLWEATLAYRAMQHNERGDYVAACAVYDEIDADYADVLSDLPDFLRRQELFQQSRSKVSAEWHGRSKRQAFSRSKKAMRQEEDHRSNESGDWHDHL